MLRRRRYFNCDGSRRRRTDDEVVFCMILKVSRSIPFSPETEHPLFRTCEHLGVDQIMSVMLLFSYLLKSHDVGMSIAGSNGDAQSTVSVSGNLKPLASFQTCQPVPPQQFGDIPL